MWAQPLSSIALAGFALAQCSQVAGDTLREQVAGCGSFFASDPRPLTEERSPPRLQIVSEKLACWDGSIERGAIEPLHAWAVTRDENKTLVIRSGGGDSEAALRLTEQLNAVGARVVVRGVCASACANYFYAGSLHRNILGEAVILFHGGFGPELRSQAEASLRALVDDNRELFPQPEQEIARNLEHFDALTTDQNRLLAQAGVSQAVIDDFYGVDLTAAPASSCTANGGDDRRFIFFSDAQLEQLGLSPRLGEAATDTDTVSEILSSLGAEFAACLAPEGSDLFRGRRE